MQSDVTQDQVNNGSRTDGTVESEAGRVMLSREQIMAARDATFEIVDVPEWGGSVRVKALSARERDAFEASTIKGTGKQQKQDLANFRAKLCALSIVDANGGRLFGDDMILALGEKSAAAVDRIFAVAQRLSRFSESDVEEIVGNSASARGGASS